MKIRFLCFFRKPTEDTGGYYHHTPPKQSPGAVRWVNGSILPSAGGTIGGKW